MACPRHRFLKRFKTAWNGPTHSLTKGTLEELLPLIYSDNALQIYVDKAGKPLPASNSEPGFAMYLLEMPEASSSLERLRRSPRCDQSDEFGQGGVVGPLLKTLIKSNSPLAPLEGQRWLQHPSRGIRSLAEEALEVTPEGG